MRHGESSRVEDKHIGSRRKVMTARVTEKQQYPARQRGCAVWRRLARPGAARVRVSSSVPKQAQRRCVANVQSTSVFATCANSACREGKFEGSTNVLHQHASRSACNPCPASRPSQPVGRRSVPAVQSPDPDANPTAPVAMGHNLQAHLVHRRGNPCLNHTERQHAPRLPGPEPAGGRMGMTRLL